ncbi:hypothetical protein [Cerasicoccus frondis]|uniref:hypothetical protein n=1 Tax=Cerasicoccus frondis TaxID=490090 RepID=UPI002852669E|nr:hypothetical protein [Cerasicoccus frondis]
MSTYMEQLRSRLDPIAGRVCGFLPIILLLSAAFTVMWMGADGFSPSADALRHVGKVFSGKDWSEIFLVRDGVYEGNDSHPGWHWLLGVLQQLTHCSPDTLLVFSMIIAYTCYAGGPLLLMRRPEAYFLAVFVAYLLDQSGFDRVFMARPFVITQAALAVYLIVWDKLAFRRSNWNWWAGVITLSALQTWIHPNWYLMAFPCGVIVLSGFLSDRLQNALAFCVAIGVGIVCGAVLTGHPAQILIYYLKHVFWAMSEVPLQTQKVPELRSYIAPPVVLLFTLGMITLRFLTPKWPGVRLSHPALILAGAGAVLGLYVGRFWMDWGLVGLTVWLALEIQAFLEAEMDAKHPARLVLAACIVFISAPFIVTMHHAGEAQSVKENIWVQQHAEQNPDWLPGPGGVVYTPDMNVFFVYFYQFPQADWRYILGYEAALMPEEDLEVYLDVKADKVLNHLQPWVDKMRPEDRLIIQTDRRLKGVFPGLDWSSVGNEFQVGRIPPKDKQQ